MTALDETLFYALREVGLDEADAETAVAAILPQVRTHAHSEYERGIEYGDKAACERIARQMGLRL